MMGLSPKKWLNGPVAAAMSLWLKRRCENVAEAEIAVTNKWKVKAVATQMTRSNAPMAIAFATTTYIYRSTKINRVAVYPRSVCS